MAKSVKFVNGKNLTLRGFVHEPLRYNTAVIFLHGFPANCGRLSAPARALSLLGNLVFRFNFSGTDTSEGTFEDKSFKDEASDIKYAIDYLAQNYNYDQLVLVGHSSGAIDAALYAHRDKRVDKVALLSGVSDLEKSVDVIFTQSQIKAFEEQGYIIYNQPDKWYHRKRLNRRFYDDLFKLNIPESLRKYHKPLLVVHGGKDEVVPVSHAQEIYDLANKPKELMIVGGADHNYSKLRHGLQVIWKIQKFIKKQ